jgi:hypothetical protein
MKLNEEISRIKKIMGLNEGQIQAVDLTPEYFMQRVPFFKTYHNNSTPKAVGFQKCVYNSNVEIYTPNTKEGDETYVFPHFNTCSQFTYSKWELNGKNQYVFSLKQEIIMSKPANMDSFLYTVMNIANRAVDEKYSYNKEFLIPGELPPADMDMVINEINGKLFHFEEYVMEKLPANVQNPHG